jgi:hypothetical protein
MTFEERPVPHPPCDPRCECGCHIHDEATYRAVAGVCPACGSQLLGISVWPKNLDSSRISCWNLACPDPQAVRKILSDTETDHVVRFGPKGWLIRHPLIERLNGGLEACEATVWMQGHIPPEADTPGRYRMKKTDQGWVFSTLAITERAD